MTELLIASVLQLDRRAVKALKITDTYSLHRIVYSLFDDVRTHAEKSSSLPSGILWADHGGDFKSRKILLLSNREPATVLDKEFGEVISKVIAPDFLKHNRYRFKVIINPTRRDNASRKLISVKGRDNIACWFIARAVQNWGFSVSKQDLQVNKVQVLQFSDKENRSVTKGQAHLQGVLTVIERDQFQKSFASGIGRGRAFGCGLLQIVPVIDNPFE